MSSSKSPRRKPGYPGSLTDLHRYRKTVHGHDGSSRIVMVRKTDQRTFASIEKGQEPKLETITRETIETFRGQRTECKFTTEKKDYEEEVSTELIEALSKRSSRNNTLVKRKTSKMEFQKECLKAHNEFRKKHGVPPLTLNKDLSKLSQEWANILIAKDTLEHRPNNEYGENIYCISSTDPNFMVTGDKPVQSWYDEITFYEFGVEPKDMKAGHFTQVIWKDSKEMGVAYAKKQGKIIVVANYSPAGNYRTQFTKNVPPIGGFKENNNNNDDPSEKLSKLSLNASKVKQFFTKKNVDNGTEGDFEEDFLAAHNEFRRRHGVSPLKLDKKLSKISQEWAKSLADRNILEHRRNSPYGENIYCIYSSDPNFTVSGKEPVNTWYEEIQFHPFGKEPKDLKSGHFTQVVWKASELLGVGVAKNRHNKIYVVANYNPPGNFVGDYIANVPPLLSSGANNEEEPSACSRIEIQSESASALDEYQYAKEGLLAHNEYRRKHGVPELTLNTVLCDFAQEWADQCAKNSDMAHRPNNKYGENIFYAYSSDYSHVPSARVAVGKWYDEIQEHTFDTEKVNNKTLHFTQVIWRESKELGMAMAKNRKGETYVVANYNPRGNYIGQFVQNVPRPKH